MNKRLLLGSGGIRTEERQEAWRSECDDFLGDVEKVLFVPYAVQDHDGYVEKISQGVWNAGRKVEGIHTFDDPIKAIEEAQAIHVGGGNSFRLLYTLQQKKLLEPIRRAVLEKGLPYMGISAGSNMACPTIMTTNDMPIVCPENFDALNLIPFQINPHYVPGKQYYYENEELVPYGGETRDDRLREYHEMNQTPILALPEGAILRVTDDQVKVCGVGNGLLFRSGKESEVCSNGSSMVIQDLG